MLVRCSIVCWCLAAQWHSRCGCGCLMTFSTSVAAVRCRTWWATGSSWWRWSRPEWLSVSSVLTSITCSRICPADLTYTTVHYGHSIVRCRLLCVRVICCAAAWLHQTHISLLVASSVSETHNQGSPEGRIVSKSMWRVLACPNSLHHCHNYSRS